MISPINSKFIKCSQCSFLNPYNKNPWVMYCVGQCKRMKEYCSINDGCTFGKLASNIGLGINNTNSINY